MVLRQLSYHRGILLAFIFALSLLTIIYAIFKKKMIDYLKKYKIFIIKKNIKILICVFSYLMFQSLLCAMLYLIILINFVNIDVNIPYINNVIGSFLLSIIIGFIFIGAPAGVGVREASMVLLTGSLISQESILLSMVIYRIVNTIGDLLGFLFALAINLKSVKK